VNTTENSIGECLLSGTHRPITRLCGDFGIDFWPGEATDANVIAQALLQLSARRRINSPAMPRLMEPLASPQGVNVCRK
jgi:hypothetical protein